MTVDYKKSGVLFQAHHGVERIKSMFDDCVAVIVSPHAAIGLTALESTRNSTVQALESEIREL